MHFNIHRFIIISHELRGFQANQIYKFRIKKLAINLSRSRLNSGELVKQNISKFTTHNS